MAGFATGFHLGASVIERGQRAAREAQEHELVQQMRAIQLANAQLGLDENRRLVADEAELRRAAAPVTPLAGQALAIAGGGQQFFSDPKAAQMAAEQERTIAEMQATSRPGEQLAQVAPAPAWAAGGQVFTDPAQAQAAAEQANTINATRERVARTLMSQGRLEEAAKLTEQVARSREEGVLKMLDVIAAGGDGNAAKEVFNRSGVERLGPNDEVRVVRRYNLERPGYAPIPTAEVQILRNGQVVQHIPDVVSLRHLSEKALEMAKQGYQAGRDEKADDRAERQLQSLEQYRRDAGRAAIIRAQRIGTDGRGAGTDRDGLTASERTTAHEKIAKILDDEFVVDPLMGDPDEAGLIEQKRSRLQDRAFEAFDLSYALWDDGQGIGGPISHHEAVQAAKAAEDPTKIIPIEAEGGERFAGVRVGRRIIPVGALPSRRAGEPEEAGDQAGEPSAQRARTPGEELAAATEQTAQQIGDPSKPPPPGLEGLDERASRVRERLREQEEREAGERRRREEAKAKRRAEAEGLTEDRIRALSRAEAERMLLRYRDVLTPEQERLLRMRM